MGVSALPSLLSCAGMHRGDDYIPSLSPSAFDDDKKVG